MAKVADLARVEGRSGSHFQGFKHIDHTELNNCCRFSMLSIREIKNIRESRVF